MPVRKLGEAVEVPFDDFAPDKPITSPGIILDAHDYVPTIKGYKARNSPALYAAALGGTPLGAYVALYADGTTSVIVGTATHLYRLILGVWTPIDTTGPFAATHPWNFAQFGDDVIAVNPDVAQPQVANGAAGTFANLGGTPPTNPTTVISVSGFAVMYKLNEWFNSSAGTDTGWTPNVQTQSGSGFLYDYPGNIVAASPFFRNQIVWKKQAMWLLSYVGGTQVWSSELISVGTGTWSQSCVVGLPEAVAFLGTDDFYISQGYAPSRIPNNLKEWFFDVSIYRDPTTNEPTFLGNTQSWFDPVESVAYWHYVSASNANSNLPDQYVAWNTRNNRWSHGYLNTNLVVNNTQPGITTGLYFDTANVLRTWTGTPGNCSILTGFQGDPDNLTQLQRVRGTYNQNFYPTSQNLIPLSAYILGQAPTVGTPGTLGQDAWFNLRQTNRYHQVQLSTVGASEIQALAYEMRVSGVR